MSSPPDPPANLTRGTVTGLGWVYGSSALGAITQTAYTAIMGRLLAPEDFGLLAMALVFQRFGIYFARMGVGQALIQKASLDDEDVRVGFTTSMLLGAVFGTLVVLLAPIAGVFFDTDGVVPVVRVLAITFLLDGLGRVSTSILRRQLRFRSIAILELTTYATSFLGVGIVMAAAGFGVWSLVGVQLAQSGMTAVWGYVLTRHPVRPSLRRDVLRKLLGYGGRLSIISFLEFLGSSLDTLVIGRADGAQRLGQYNRGFLLVTLPFTQIVEGLSRVLFPSFAQIQGDRVRLRGAYGTAVGGISALLLPLAAGLAVAAPEVVLVVIGPQWEEAAQILPFLAFAGAMSFLSHLGGVVCDATATLNRKLLLQSTYLVLLAALLLGATTLEGLRPYAAALLLAEVVRQLLYQRLMARVLDHGVIDHLRLYVGPLVTAAGVAVSIGTVTSLLRSDAPLLVTFGAQVGVGALVLAAAVFYGPLAPVRHDVHGRLVNAGLLDGSRWQRVARRVFEHGR